VSDTATRLAAAEADFQKLQKEYDDLSAALGDPEASAWVFDHGRAPPRKLSAFEAATVKRLTAIEPKLGRLEAQRNELRATLVCELAGVPEDSEVDDPEVLLRAALVALYRVHKAGASTIETRTVLMALSGYVKSLANDDDD
jgi:hypothetical protein